MNRGGMARHFLIVFLVVLGLYLAGYFGLEHLRERKGPWEVVFSTEDGDAVVTVRQKTLGIEGVRFVFPGQGPQVSMPGGPETVLIRAPVRSIPFGRVVFYDATFLPGTVTFEFFGHLIELLPRVLVIDRKEIPWRSHQAYVLPPVESPAETKPAAAPASSEHRE